LALQDSDHTETFLTAISRSTTTWRLD